MGKNLTENFVKIFFQLQEMRKSANLIEFSKNLQFVTSIIFVAENSNIFGNYKNIKNF